MKPGIKTFVSLSEAKDLDLGNDNYVVIKK